MADMHTEDSSNVPSIKRRQYTKLQAVLLSLAVFFAVIFAVYWYHRPSKRELKAALSEVNRVVVDPNVGPLHEPNVPTHEILGEDKIRDFLDGVHINRLRSVLACLCFGDLRLKFYEDNTLVCTLTYHHHESLRWQGGPWSADARLTKESTAEIERWLIENGCPPIEEMIQANRKRIRKFMGRESINGASSRPSSQPSPP